MRIAWGIVGAGRIAGQQMAPAIALAPNHELVAVMRRNGDQAHAFAQKHNARRSYNWQAWPWSTPPTNLPAQGAMYR